jgi:hypothetical protein
MLADGQVEIENAPRIGARLLTASISDVQSFPANDDHLSLPKAYDADMKHRRCTCGHDDYTVDSLLTHTLRWMPKGMRYAMYAL